MADAAEGGRNIFSGLQVWSGYRFPSCPPADLDSIAQAELLPECGRMVGRLGRHASVDCDQSA